MVTGADVRPVRTPPAAAGAAQDSGTASAGGALSSSVGLGAHSAEFTIEGGEVQLKLWQHSAGSGPYLEGRIGFGIAFPVERLAALERAVHALRLEYAVAEMAPAQGFHPSSK
jgi:hypothetical protein